MALVLAAGIVLPLIGARSGRASARAVGAVRADLAQHVADTVRLREEVLAVEAEAQRLRGIADLDRRLARAQSAAGRRVGARSAFTSARVWIGTLATVLASAPAIAAAGAAGNAAAALPGALLAAALIGGTAPALETIERLAGSLPAGLEATRRIRTLAAGRPVVSEPASPQPVPPLPTSGAAARLEAVRFAYPGRDQPALDGVDLEIPAGSTIGLVGATGSGKSTVALLLQRHWDPESGTVRLRGVDARELGSAPVRRLVAVADQEPFLREGTVADNLRLGAPDADDAALLRALATAQLRLEDLVPAGSAPPGSGAEAAAALRAPIGRRGALLSGGQRQRLALARTLLRAQSSPEGLTGALLVLDEATSHQDPLTQSRMVQALRGLGTTVVVIAHRLETLREADRILVVERGRIVEGGRFEELAAAGGAFAALLAANTGEREDQ